MLWCVASTLHLDFGCGHVLVSVLPECLSLAPLCNSVCTVCFFYTCEQSSPIKWAKFGCSILKTCITIFGLTILIECDLFLNFLGSFLISSHHPLLRSGQLPISQFSTVFIITPVDLLSIFRVKFCVPALRHS